MIETKYILWGLFVVACAFMAVWLFNFVSPFAAFGLFLIIAIPINFYFNRKNKKQNEKN